MGAAADADAAEKAKEAAAEAEAAAAAQAHTNVGQTADAQNEAEQQALARAEAERIHKEEQGAMDAAKVADDTVDAIPASCEQLAADEEIAERDCGDLATAK